MAADRSTFDAAGPLPAGLVALEASAGTGKTYALSSLAARFVAEQDIPVAALCIVSFTDAATAELRGRVRTRLVETLAHLQAGAPVTDDPVLAAIGTAGPNERVLRVARVRSAINDFDSATITTIHGFCNRVLTGSGTAASDAAISAGGSEVDEVVNDLVLARFGHRVDVDVKPRWIVQAVETRLAMPTAEMARPALMPEPVTGHNNLIEQRRRQHAILFADLVDEAHDLVLARRAARRRRTFDGVLADTRALLTSARGVTAVTALRDRYRVVLIDEFQDTDRVQWDIFRTAFVGGDNPATVVLVGDPKQSIYRFRAAELSAYLDAVGAASSIATLDTNWRSDGPLLGALERWFGDFTFGDPEVRFQRVGAAAGNELPRLRGDGGSALELRVVPRPVGEEGFSMPTARAAVRDDVVTTVVGLLRSGILLDDVKTGERPLRARDIAILTRSNAEATSLALALGRGGVPAASASANSVLDSVAERQWAILLRALERPGSPGAARAAALGWFLNRSAAEVATFTDEQLAGVHDLLREWSIVLAQRGAPHLLALARAEGLAQHRLAHHGGERELTDLEHIAELLHTVTRGRPVGASALLAVLEALSEPDDNSNGENLPREQELSRRIDRDDDAVQVLTVHKAKGLEFPVVLCPYLWTKAFSRRGIPHAHLEGGRLLDSTWLAGAGNLKLNKVLRTADDEERKGEERRLLYVSLTRAKHRCIVWTAEMDKPQVSGLAELLAHACGDGGDIEALIAGHPDMARRVGHPAAPPRFVVEADDDGSRLAVATAERRLDSRWRIWSFSAIKRESERWQDAHPSVTSEPEPSVAGGADESPLDDPPQPDVASTPLVTAPGGTTFGTLVHEVFELIDFASPTLADDLREVCATQLQYRNVRIVAEDLAAGLLTAIEAPLGGPEGATRLRDLPRTDRLDELVFNLPLGTLTADQIGAVLVEHLPLDDPLRPWAEGIATTGFGIDLAGQLSGSIDLVARSGGGERFWVADYKTNQLGASAYTRDDMAAAMAHHHYPLQAALYLVALHRYLRWRVPGYRPDEHLGGAAYLFVRGMDPARPADDARGVFWWQPPAAAVLALDDLLAGEGGP